MPDWYWLMKDAEILGVPPWELVGRSQVWALWKRQLQQAEYQAANPTIVSG